MIERNTAWDGFLNGVLSFVLIALTMSLFIYFLANAALLSESLDSIAQSQKLIAAAQTKCSAAVKP